ncbi:hypothetical protein BVG16_16065 [Paenibacillus selenitireducens]|uniref:DUF2062 domain-containing protein n=1 Tax=Paenibacillus selenitireducens TaxID=1324314 RepID=A0A1T2X9W1_9BACL|nr:DUF2062 domain-containing protein [Paenibacillus selenitireducens]OPA76687.1 hypothetical protein BVG16_16065 [Paenibacillus selenitireducens]
MPRRNIKWVNGMKRWLKYKYLMLIRARGGGAKVAKGFSIGIAIEMFTLPTAGLAFFFIFPLVYLLRASFASALIGFVFGKIIYIPFSFLNGMVGGMLLPKHVHIHIPYVPEWINRFMMYNLKLIVGGIVDGILLGLILYLPVKWLIDYVGNKRKEKRKTRRLQIDG